MLWPQEADYLPAVAGRQVAEGSFFRIPVSSARRPQRVGHEVTSKSGSRPLRMAENAEGERGTVIVAGVATC